ncbi:unnamed protein product [Phaeothamnion confervicola]
MEVPTPKARRRKRPAVCVHGMLPRSSPYIGTVAHAPSAGNRGRQTFFERQILTLEQLQRQHEVRVNVFTGIFHYGDELYGSKMEQFRKRLFNIAVRASRVVVFFFSGFWTPRPFSQDLAARNTRLAAHAHRARARSRSGAGLSTPNGSSWEDYSFALATPHHRPSFALDTGSESSPAFSAMNGTGDLSMVPPLADGLGGGSLTYGGGANGNGSSVFNGVNGSDGGGSGGGGGVGGGGGGGSGASATPTERASSSGTAASELRRSAYALVVYGSGDNLCKMVEKERRRHGNSGRLKYNGAIDTSKRYPKSGSLDDCALMCPVGAERSKLYNDLTAEVNGFRRHFFLQHRLHPKEAYLQRKLRSELAVTRLDGLDLAHMAAHGAASPYHADPAAAAMYRRLALEMAMAAAADAAAAHAAATAAAGSSPVGDEQAAAAAAANAAAGGGELPSPGLPLWAGGGDPADYAGYPPPGHPVPAPPGVQLLQPPPGRPRRRSSIPGPGATWFPETLSAHYKKESWKNKQLQRSSAKFQPFFVHAKTDISDAYELLEHKVLGQGSYASVILAVHRKSGDKVAVKAVQKRLLFTDMEKKSVMQEIENQLRIIHR